MSIFSMTQGSPFGDLFASGAVGALGAGLLSGRGSQGIMAGFGGANTALQAYQQKQLLQQRQAAQAEAFRQAAPGLGYSPEVAGLLSGMAPEQRQKIVAERLKFNKDRELLNALSDPSNPLNAAARVQYGTQADADTILTQDGLNFRHNTVSANTQAQQEGQDRRQVRALTQDEVQDIRANDLARDKFAQDRFEFGQEYAIKQYRANLDGKKFDRSVLENDRDFAQGVTEFNRTDATRRRGQDLTAQSAAARLNQPTAIQRNLAAAGIGPDDPRYAEALLARGGVTVNNNAASSDIPIPAFNKLPAGYVYQRDQNGQVMIDANGAPQAIPIPGGPVDAANQEAAAAEDARQALTDKTGGVVVEDVDRMVSAINDNDWGLFNTTTGLIGSVLSGVPGTAARDVAALAETVRGNAGFDKLQAMREASPTGGALGQVSNVELRQLNAAIGNLEQSQTQEQLLFNLNRVKELYLDAIHGPGNRPDQFSQSGGQSRRVPEASSVDYKSKYGLE